MGVYVDHAFGALFEKWQGEGKCIRIGRSPLNAIRHQPEVPTPPLHKAEISDTSTHTTWADDIILVASTKGELGEMIGAFIGRAEAHSLSIQ